MSRESSGDKGGRAAGEMHAALRGLPSVDRLLSHPAWADAREVPAPLRRDACRAVVDEARRAILGGGCGTEPPGLDALTRQAVELARADVRPALRRIVNATGVILHTNLGRAPLPDAALRAISELGGRYVNVEMETDAGVRDSRHDRLRPAFARVLRCQDAVVVNNNASAVFLALRALAGDGAGVVVSRGELVEIGGSFRMPDIMEQSGARLVEVGTTNRTHGRDYEAALDSGARLVMKVHRSNFEVLGFTAEVGIGELARIAHARGALLLHDLGSGMLDAHPAMGRDSVHASLDAGADLVLFSGDKMLGGPQAGIAAGHEDLVMRMRKHPLMRMLRPDKLQLIALEATLLAWERDPLGGEVPAARMLGRGDDELKATAERVLARVVPLLEGRGVEARAERVESTTGGGSAALVRLPSWAVVITPARGAEGGADAALAAALRQGDPCVVGRIEDGRVILDVRTLLDPADEDALVAALGCCASASR